MAREISNTYAYPYQAVTMIVVTYPDGTQVFGTGALVGPNDILTATHVLYSEENGGWAADIELYPGADYNGSQSRFDDRGVMPLENFEWEAVGWPSEVYSDYPDYLLSEYESQYDVALLGIDQPIGDTLGWFGMDTGYNYGHTARQLGYPSEGTGLMYGEIYVSPDPYFNTYEASGWSAGDHFGGGSSGGPLYVVEGGNPYIIGVKSAGSDDSSVWADIGFLYDEIQDAIRENDHLIDRDTSPQPEPEPEPTPIDDRAKYSEIYHATGAPEDFFGTGGLDLIVYEQSFAQYDVIRWDLPVEVQLPDGRNFDLLYDIERLQFADGLLAVDVGEGETAGSAYRLYQAAFDRTPDTGGLTYWIDQMDLGDSLKEVAASFVASDEFRSIYGAQPTPEDLVSRYYFNVLERAPDQGGLNYWVGELTRPGGLTPVDVLMSFSESDENQARVAPAIDDGIWLG